MIITMRDVRACNMCAKGAREFFQRHNLSWQDFIKNGIDSALLEKTGDAMAIKVIENAKR